MNFGSLIKTGVKTVGQWTKKHAPELLLAGGITGFGGALYFTAKGAIASEGLAEEFLEEREDIETKKELVKLYSNTALKYSKNFAPAAGFTAVSLTCFCSSYGILKKRYVALGAAYTALEAAYQTYRQRVIEDAGIEKDKYYLTGVKASKVTDTDEDGNKVKKLVIDGDIEVANPYAFKFSKYKEDGSLNKEWQNNAHLNQSIVLGHQDYLTDMLFTRSTLNSRGEVIKRGSVMLNEVRTLLGEDPTTTGAVVGWRYSNGEPGCNGYVDFRIIEGLEEDPETGFSIPYILIDPNVDGLIYDLLDKFEEEPWEPVINE